MNHSYTVFISYSWRQLDYRNLLLPELNKIKDIEIFCDHIMAQASADVWSKISDGIDRCDIILTILSKDALESPEVKDELTRANDRGKPIIPVFETNETDRDIIKSLPHFLRTTLQIQFVKGKLSDALPQIKETIETKRDLFNTSGNRERLLKSLADLRKLVTHNDERRDVSDLLMKNIINNSISEIRQVISLQYDVDLGREHDFLLRAGPLFGSAKEIYAVTLAWISDFWTDSNNRLYAINYLRSQSQSTIRLFVFRNPSEFKKYKEVLDANYLRYGENGGVLVTSKKSYESILSRFCVNDMEKLLNTDFGFLRYEDDVELFAWLDSSKLGFKDASLPSKFAINYQSFITTLKRLNKVDTGSFCQPDLVYKWKSDLSEQEIIEVSSALFGKTSGEAIHIVVFNNETLLNKLAEVKNKVEQLASRNYQNSRLRCIESWFGKVCDLKATDSTYEGRLSHVDQYNYMLYMRFEDTEALKAWYTHPAHSGIRRELYCLLSAEAREKYQLIDELKSSGQRAKMQALFEEIEDIIYPKYLNRMDFVEELTPEIITHIKSYEFLQAFKNAVKSD
jgi:hypothetical protein